MAVFGAVAVISELVGLTGVFASDVGFVAGTAPSIRPDGAPQITEFIPSKSWREQALYGVEQPYPDSLSWLDDQGAWFTPFIWPGMTGPYDIRGWHASQ